MLRRAKPGYFIVVILDIVLAHNSGVGKKKEDLAVLQLPD